MRGAGLWIVDSSRSLTAWGKKTPHPLGFGPRLSVPFPRRQQLKQFVVGMDGVLYASEGIMVLNAE